MSVEHSSLTLKKQDFETKVLRRIFGLKRYGTVRGCSKFVTIAVRQM
jgi:hypothetical protein